MSRIHCCYIIIGKEFKEKHTLEEDELFCCIIISSGLKEKKKVYVTMTKECRKKKIVLFSSLRAPDSLSTYPRINSLHIYICIYIHIYVFIHIYFLFPYRLLQYIEYRSLCYTVGHCWLSILYIVMCIG